MFDQSCPVCWEDHPPCYECFAPTHCSWEDPGEPFSLCDHCMELDKIDFYGDVPRDDWPDCDVPHSSFWAQRPE